MPGAPDAGDLSTRHGYYAPSSCRPRDGPRVLPRLRWLHVVGDSVTYNLFGSIKRAFAAATNETLTWGDSEQRRTTRKGSQTGPPRWKCACTATRTHCVTMATWFDTGPEPGPLNMTGSTLSGPAVPARTRPPFDKCVVNSSVHPDVTYLSLGSHHQWAADASERYRQGFPTWLSAQPRRAGVVLALRSAQGLTGTPDRYGGVDVACRATNLRVERNNAVQVAALRAACASRRMPNCRVLDLFSPTLPWIADRRVFRPGDPVHFRNLGVGWVQHLLLDVLRSVHGLEAAPPAARRPAKRE